MRSRRAIFFGFLRRHGEAILLWGGGGCLIFGGLILLWAATLKIPDLSSIENRKVEQSLKIYDRSGTVLLYDLNKNIDRTIVPLDQISPSLQAATISSEDPTFYENMGIRPSAILRAVIADIIPGGVVQGGSTITQQVVKQTLLTGDKTITRKLKEWVLALKLTRTLSKDQILELYLNQSPYGGALYGVESASEAFFGIHASEVNLAQAAYLTAVLPAPTYYSPYGNHTAALDARKNTVLDRMYLHGSITAEERDAAKAEKVVFVQQHNRSIQAPHFVFYVEQYLENKYGPDVLEQSGWKVISTLDADLQEHAEETVQSHALDNVAKFNATNMGLLALDPSTGQILVMVGSRNYFDSAIDGNFNITLANRQPGSTFKPFAYAAAFEKGYTPDTVLFDIPTQFSTNCQPNDLTMGGEKNCYAPQDYDGKWRGPMTLRNALAQSINVPSVEALYLAGISDTLSLAKAMGITTLGNPNQYGLTLVLGGGEVNLLEMTSAYGTFAQQGVHRGTTAVLRIEDDRGNIIEDNSAPLPGVQVMPASVAASVTDILSDSIARSPLGENDILGFPGYDVADKTGTTNDFRDAWVIGYTPNFVAGAWAGNNDNSPMQKKVGGLIVAPAWHDFMRYALARGITNASSSEPNIPISGTFARADETSYLGLKPVLRGIWQGGDSTVVDSRTGAPASINTPPEFLQERVTCNVHNLLYWVDKNAPTGGTPGPGSTDSQFPYWESAIQRWLAQGNGCAPGSQVITGSASPASLLPIQTMVPLQGQ